MLGTGNYGEVFYGVWKESDSIPVAVKKVIPGIIPYQPRHILYARQAISGPLVANCLSEG